MSSLAFPAFDELCRIANSINVHELHRSRRSLADSAVQRAMILFTCEDS